MFIDRLKTVNACRASRITGIDRHVISKAMDLWTKTNGKLGLAYVSEGKRRRIRLCAIDDWLAQKEAESRYV